MKCGKSNLINYENYNEYIRFSKEISSVKIEYIDQGVDKFLLTQDIIWIVHELDFLNLIEHIAPGSVVVAVIPADSAVGDIFELPFNLINYYKEKRITIIYGGSFEDQAALCSSLIDIDKYSGWKPFFGKNIIEREVQYFKSFYRSLGAKINVKNLYKNTSIHTTHLFLRNALINAPLVHQSVRISSFFGALPNKPILVVAAGPSLNKQMPLLAKHQNNFNILAVDTVWPILDKYGITPDLVFAIDSRSKPSWTRNCMADKTCFSVDIGCAPKLVWSHDQNHLFSSTSEQIRGLLESLGVQVDILPTGGSVATSAFNFARSLGGNPIILIGQDLALTDGKDHADGYLHVYSADLMKARSEAGFDVEGYYGGRVKTESQLLYYKTWYEEQVKIYPDVMIINSTEGGAKIQGCLQIPFEAVCNELEKFNIAKEFIFPKYKIIFNSERLIKLSKNIDILMESVQGFIELAREGEFMIDEKGGRSSSKLLKKIDKLNDKIRGYDSNARFVVDAFSQLKMETIRFQVLSDKTDKNIHKAVAKYMQIYVGIQESGHLAAAMLQQIQKLYHRISECQSYDPDLLEELFDINFAT